MYGLQMYPTARTGTANHYLVENATPMMRVLPKESFPGANDRCRFDVDSALIFVAGVNNPYLGETWNTTDGELLASMLAWNRNKDQPFGNFGERPGHDKLKQIPGYIQIVGNKNTATGGVLGTHDDQAITRLKSNIEMAYRSGVKNLELVSHSNGMITTHGGLTQFGRVSQAILSQWQKEREANNPGVGKMIINAYHLQAAPSQKWSVRALDKFGERSDYLPNAKVAKRTVGGVTYDGWEWDFSVYNRLESVADLTIRYYYNAVDGYTYPSLTTTVGRKSSLSWHNEVRDEGHRGKVRTVIKHYGCPSRDESICGPDHQQRLVLWDFTNPVYTQNQGPIRWDLELVSNASDNASSRGTTAAATAGGFQLIDDEDVVEAGSFNKPPVPMPAVICLDARKQQKICGGQAPSAPEANIQPALVPGAMCSVAEDTQSPCLGSTCGDGICGLGEQCAEDCKLPKKYSTCACAGEECLRFQVDCKDGNCRVLGDAEKVDICTCQSEHDMYQCEPFRDACEVATLDTGCAITGNTEINPSRDIPVAAAGVSSMRTNKMSEPIFPR